MAGHGFLPSTPVSSTNKTDCHDITEMLLKVALNTINQTVNHLQKSKSIDGYLLHVFMEKMNIKRNIM